MNKLEIRAEAQSYLLGAAQVAFNKAQEADEKPETLAEMDKQFRRIEKLFGYIEGSWSRGV